MTRARVRTLSLVVSSVLLEVVTCWCAFRAYDLLTTLFTVLQVVSVLGLVVCLLVSKGDHLFRYSVLTVTLLYLGYMAYQLWGFLTCVD